MSLLLIKLWNLQHLKTIAALKYLQDLANKNTSSEEQQKNVTSDLVQLTSSTLDDVNVALEVVENVLNGSKEKSEEVFSNKGKENGAKISFVLLFKFNNSCHLDRFECFFSAFKGEFMFDSLADQIAPRVATIDKPKKNGVMHSFVRATTFQV